MHILPNISRYLILFLMDSSNNISFCVFVTMIYWTSTEVLLKCCSTGFSCAFYFEQIKVFLTSGFDSISIAFDSLSVSRSLSNCISHIQFKCSFFWPWENQYIVHGFDSISIIQFPTMICSVSAEGSLNHVAHLI